MASWEGFATKDPNPEARLTRRTFAREATDAATAINQTELEQTEIAWPATIAARKE